MAGRCIGISKLPNETRPFDIVLLQAAGKGFMVLSVVFSHLSSLLTSLNLQASHSNIVHATIFFGNAEYTVSILWRLSIKAALLKRGRTCQGKPA